MESIKRILMVLKPADNRLIQPGKSGGMLKIQSLSSEKASGQAKGVVSKEGLSLSVKTDCLKEGSFCLYLFLADGKDLNAGELKQGALNSEIHGTRLQDIKGAAVVNMGSAGSPSFVLRSTGLNWPKIIERFKLTKSAGFKDVAPRNQDPAKSIADNDIPDTSVADNDIPHVTANTYETPDSGAIENNGAGFEDSGCDECPYVVRQTKVNPFPSVFPDSEWVKISYPGPAGWWHYISGKIYRNSSVVAKVLGVPGEYGMAPPIWLEGFGTYMRCSAEDARGYWLMFQDAETGEVLDMGLSPHGG